MSVAQRRIVTGHDASGRSVVPIAASEPEPTDRPVRTPPPAGGVVVRFTEMVPGAAPLEFFDQALD